MSAGVLLVTTLPAIVVLLVVVAAVETVVSRRRRRAGDETARTPVAAAGFDAFTGVVAPGSQDALEHRASQRVRRSDDADGTPPWGRVDLERGVVRLRVSGLPDRDRSAPAD
ncbi:hypothetical protein FE697_005230 [Mumia zhuanghuii]|uniref:DUF6191 domain-containing protein n=2 Tax=Mumia TaxID=1546255 RepID=A0ABW1QGP2_9ACTN|nr:MULTISPECIES: DUF6191 domain-containing protein [Mumia]KAA1425270.1 hypothetical protein FE697_005230 [Mumia zhuanghuii]